MVLRVRLIWAQLALKALSGEALLDGFLDPDSG